MEERKRESYIEGRTAPPALAMSAVTNDGKGATVNDKNGTQRRGDPLSGGGVARKAVKRRWQRRRRKEASSKRRWQPPKGKEGSTGLATARGTQRDGRGGRRMIGVTATVVEDEGQRRRRATGMERPERRRGSEEETWGHGVTRTGRRGDTGELSGTKRQAPARTRRSEVNGSDGTDRGAMTGCEGHRR